MTNYDRNSHYCERPVYAPASKQAPPEETLHSGKVTVERKLFLLTLKENARGRFLRITEEAKGRRNTIIVPSTGLEDFKKVLDEMVRSAGPGGTASDDSG